jgi:non-heme chloroperoxidase
LIYLDAGYDYALDVGAPLPNGSPPPGAPPMPPIGEAILDGKRDFKGPIDLPILAIYANPHNDPSMTSAADKAALKKLNVVATKQIAGFRRVLPNAKVIVIPNANHFVFLSNTDEVLRDVNAFISALPAQ